MRIVLVYIIICIKEAFNFRFTIFRVGVAFGAGMLLIERARNTGFSGLCCQTLAEIFRPVSNDDFPSHFPIRRPYSRMAASRECALNLYELNVNIGANVELRSTAQFFALCTNFQRKVILYFLLFLSLSLSSILCRLFVVFYKFIVFSYAKRQARAHSRNTFHSTVHGVCWFWFVFRKSKMKRAACVCLFIRANDIRVHNAVGDRQWMIGCIKSSGSSQTVEPVQHSY